MRALAVLLLAAGCGGAAIPEVPTEGMDRAVAAAVRDALEATRAEPSEPARWLRLAMTLHAHRIAEPSGAAYAEAARLDADDHRAPHLHGRLVEAGDPVRALELAQRSLERNPGFPPSLALRARALEALGEDAAAAWQELARAAPDSVEAGLARARRLLPGDPTAAAAILERLPGSAAGWSFLAQARSRRGDAAGAQDAADRARSAAPAGDPDPLLLMVEDLRRDPTGREARARRAAASGNHEAAEALYRNLAQERPRSSALRYNHANALARLGRTGDAEAAYRDALALDPESSPALANLANLLARSGRNAEAAELYRRSAAGDPEHLPTLLGASSLSFQRGDLREAERLLRQALEIDPEHPAALQGLGQLLASQGRFASAADALGLALLAASEPGARAGIHFLLADVERSRGRRAAALAHVERAEALGMDVPPAFLERLRR